MRGIHKFQLLAGVLLLALGALSVVVGSPTPSMAAGEAQRMGRLLVLGDEFKVQISRTRLSPGKVKVQFKNLGEDPHNVLLRRLDSKGRGYGKIYRLPVTSPGGLRERTFTLRRGTYRVWCSVGHHRRLGMEARLRVK
jgi:plastocyanin